MSTIIGLLIIINNNLTNVEKIPDVCLSDFQSLLPNQPKINSYLIDSLEYFFISLIGFRFRIGFPFESFQINNYIKYSLN